MKRRSGPVGIGGCGTDGEHNHEEEAKRSGKRRATFDMQGLMVCMHRTMLDIFSSSLIMDTPAAVCAHSSGGA